MAKKLTKKDVLTAINIMAEDNASATITLEDGIEVTMDDVMVYVANTIDQLNKKNEKAKEKAAEKRAVGDALSKEIESALTEDYQTIPQLIEILDIEDLTPGKVSARLTQLIKAGKAHKEKVKFEGRTINGYAIGVATEAVEAD